VILLQNKSRESIKKFCNFLFGILNILPQSSR